jgi:hypothetical protein
VSAGVEISELGVVAPVRSLRYVIDASQKCHRRAKSISGEMKTSQ